MYFIKLYDIYTHMYTCYIVAQACLPSLGLCMHAPHHIIKTQCLCTSLLCIDAFVHMWGYTHVSVMDQHCIPCSHLRSWSKPMPPHSHTHIHEQTHPTPCSHLRSWSKAMPPHSHIHTDTQSCTDTSHTLLAGAGSLCRAALWLRAGGPGESGCTPDQHLPPGGRGGGRRSSQTTIRAAAGIPSWTPTLDT